MKIKLPIYIDINLLKIKNINVSISEKEIEEALYEVCDEVHSSCCEECPVYSLMTQEERNNLNCSCFKNGKLMKEFILKRGLNEFNQSK